MIFDWSRRGVAEFIGAFTLTLVGAGAGMIAAGYNQPDIGVAIANGLAIGIMVSALGHISGGHFNPAVTFGFLITRRIGVALGAFYVVVQLAAASCAALLLNWFFDNFPGTFRTQTHLGAPALSSFLTSGQGLVIEAIGTFFLVLVVFATAVDERGTFKAIAGLGIGLTIAIYVLFAGRLTGSAINPSRAFGPMLVANYWAHWWVYWVGPLLGGGIAALVYEMVYLREPPKRTPAPEVDEPGIERTAEA